MPFLGRAFRRTLAIAAAIVLPLAAGVTPAYAASWQDGHRPLLLSLLGRGA